MPPSVRPHPGRGLGPVSQVQGASGNLRLEFVLAEVQIVTEKIQDVRSAVGTRTCSDLTAKAGKEKVISI